MNIHKINPLLKQLDVDYLYHLGIDSSMDLEQLFSDIKYVVFSRFNVDTSVFVHEFAKQWYQIKEENFGFKPLFKTERYHLHKVGPVLVVSHGVGFQSMSICLNEIVKLLMYAKASSSVVFFKLGPAGGIGVEPGEMVISNATMNHQFKPHMSLIACGEEHVYPTQVDHALFDDMVTYKNTSQKMYDLSIQAGGTLNTSDYYEGQARSNGFLPLPYSKEMRDAYLEKARNLGIKSIDMESLYFSGFCNQLDISMGIINLIIVNRLLGDEILINKSQQLFFQRHVSQFLASYIIHKISTSL
jgi:uridine phosphorylase